jgi:hypothetical protein
MEEVLQLVPRVPVVQQPEPPESKRTAIVAAIKDLAHRSMLLAAATNRLSATL